jgi:glycosyltransferase involved in cell wall biosynthesis
MTSLAVLIATYRRDDPVLLDAALRSVLDQQLPPDYAVHVYLGIDGQIGPELEATVERHVARLHRVIRSPHNEGLASTLNKLIHVLCDEPFIFRMDADDFSLPMRFQKQLDFLQNHPDVDIVGSDITECDNASDERRQIAFARDHADAVRKISRRVPVAHPTVCFRRHVFDLVPQYPTEAGNEDVAMWFKCMNAGLRFGNVHEPLLNFNINSGFWSRRSVTKAFSEFKCYVRGIWMLNGYTWQYAYPVARLLVRISPRSVSKFLYGTTMRSR